MSVATHGLETTVEFFFRYSATGEVEEQTQKIGPGVLRPVPLSANDQRCLGTAISEWAVAKNAGGEANSGTVEKEVGRCH